MSSSCSSSSFCADMETNSPAAIEKAPATRPASPASLTTPAAGPAPATPRMSETLVSRPSLMPNTAARAAPPWTSRWCEYTPWYPARRCDMSARRFIPANDATHASEGEFISPELARLWGCARGDLVEDVMQRYGGRREDRDDVHHLDHRVDR